MRILVGVVGRLLGTEEGRAVQDAPLEIRGVDVDARVDHADVDGGRAEQLRGRPRRRQADRPERVLLWVQRVVGAGGGALAGGISPGRLGDGGGGGVGLTDGDCRVRGQEAGAELGGREGDVGIQGAYLQPDGGGLADQGQAGREAREATLFRPRRVDLDARIGETDRQEAIGWSGGWERGRGRDRLCRGEPRRQQEREQQTDGHRAWFRDGPKKGDRTGAGRTVPPGK